MIVSDMTYDIRTMESAKQTLINLTGVPITLWEEYLGLEQKYRYTDWLVEEVVRTHGYLPQNYMDFEFVYFHITTSANECLNFWKYGILDLKQAYSCHDSEIRNFLEKHNIHISLDEKLLTHYEKSFDISYGKYPGLDTKSSNCWSMGRKFYYDFTTCGFLSVSDRSPYGGQVHHRPEFLMDIDNLLDLKLSQEWALTHEPYSVLAKVKGKEIVYDGDEDQSDEEKVLNYLTKAYYTAFGEPSENIILMKNNIQILPSDIIEIKPLEYWKNN